MRWKTRMGLGVLAVLVGLLAFGGAAAAHDGKLASPTTVTVEALSYHEILVEWEYDDQGRDAVEEFEIGYVQHDSAVMFGSGSPSTVKVRQQRGSTVLSGLVAGKRYLIAVRALPADEDDTHKDADEEHDTSDWGYATGDSDTDPAPTRETSLSVIQCGGGRQGIDSRVG